MTRRVVLVLVALLGVMGQAPVPGSDGPAPPLAELDALRIEKLVAERRALEERADRL